MNCPLTPSVWSKVGPARFQESQQGRMKVCVAPTQKCLFANTCHAPLFLGPSPAWSGVSGWTLGRVFPYFIYPPQGRNEEGGAKWRLPGVGGPWARTALPSSSPSRLFRHLNSACWQGLAFSPTCLASSQSQNNCGSQGELGVALISILQMRKLRQKEVPGSLQIWPLLSSLTFEVTLQRF